MISLKDLEPLNWVHYMRSGKQLSRISLIWWGRLGLNQRPTGYEPAALTAELRPRGYLIDYSVINLSGL